MFFSVVSAIIVTITVTATGLLEIRIFLGIKFDEWIESNNGKSKFTKGNYGIYKIGQLQIKTYSDEVW
jgi:hypothetical protein